MFGECEDDARSTSGGIGASSPGEDASAKNQGGGPGIARLSSALQLQLKVLRKCAERLLEEKGQVNDIRDLLDQAIKDIDKEIADIKKMKELAEEAELFQHRNVSVPRQESESPESPEPPRALVDISEIEMKYCPAFPDGPSGNIAVQVVGEEADAEIPISDGEAGEEMTYMEL